LNLYYTVTWIETTPTTVKEEDFPSREEASKCQDRLLKRISLQWLLPRLRGRIVLTTRVFITLSLM